MRTDRIVSSLALALFAACAAPATPNQDDVGPPYSVEFGPEEVALAIREGGAIPMRDFVKIAQRVTGRIITYRAGDLAGDVATVRFIGAMKIPNESFFSFFETMLHINGFACTARAHGDLEIVEIVRLPANDGTPNGGKSTG